MRRLSLVLAVCSCLLAAPAAWASPSVRYGIQDDAWLGSGPGSLDERLAALDRLGTDVVRFDLRWDQIAASGPDPSSWDWSVPDAVLAGLRAHGIEPVLTLYGTSGWANGGRGPNFAPGSAATFAAFAREAATRYSWVRDWTIWNEPNQPLSLIPTTAAAYVRLLLNPGYAAIHAVIPSAQVAGGVTAPRANAHGVDPLSWIRGMRAAHARLDVYAHHPYPGSPRETPFRGGCGDCRAITMANLPVLLREVARDFPRAHVWLTEYGYQTNPPDRYFGVSPAQQAALNGEAALRAYELPRVDMLIQFIYRDEPQVGRWQSGLVTVGGRSKPSLAAFALPLAEVARHGAAAVLWGQVRPGAATTVRLEVLAGSSGWRTLGAPVSTSIRGFFRRTVRLPVGARVRAWSAATGYGATVTLS